jgi:hypothetical protein
MLKDIEPISNEYFNARVDHACREIGSRGDVWVCFVLGWAACCIPSIEAHRLSTP